MLAGCSPSSQQDFIEPSPSPEPEPEPDEQDIDEEICQEATFRGGLHRQGRTDQVIPRSRPELVLAFNPSGSEPWSGDLWFGGLPHGAEPDDPPNPADIGMFIGASPLVCGDSLYISATGASVYRLNLETAQQSWEYETGVPLDRPMIWSTPVISDSTLAVSGVDRLLHVLNAETGEARWVENLGSDSLSSPALLRGQIFTSTKEGVIYAFDELDGTLTWQTNLESTVSASASFDDGGQRMLLGARNGLVSALAVSDGEVLWDFDTGQQVLSSAAWLEHTWYVGSWSNKVFALDQETGTELWSFESGANVTASPAVTEDLVIVGSWDWQLYFLDRHNGEVVAAAGLGSDALASPVVDATTVLQVTEDGVVHALDLVTAEVLWTVPLEIRIIATPTVHEGRIYLQAVNGDVFVLESLDDS